MKQEWQNQEIAGRGTKFCLVMDPEDGTNAIRTYGWSEREVLDKVARTAMTAQAVINRQRSARPQPERTHTPPNAPAPRAAVTTEELLQASRDISNGDPAKTPAAVTTLLRSAGFDVDKIKLREEAEAAAAVAQEWERRHPDFPSDPRNSRLMMDRAILLANGKLGQITAGHLDSAYEYLLSYGMFFEPVGEEPNAPLSDAPNGNSDSRGERHRSATSYRTTSLRGTAPARTDKPLFTDAELDAMNSKVFEEKILRDPKAFAWYNARAQRQAAAVA